MIVRQKQLASELCFASWALEVFVLMTSSDIKTLVNIKISHLHWLHFMEGTVSCFDVSHTIKFDPTSM